MKKITQKKIEIFKCNLFFLMGSQNTPVSKDNFNRIHYLNTYEDVKDKLTSEEIIYDNGNILLTENEYNKIEKRILENRTKMLSFFKYVCKKRDENGDNTNDDSSVDDDSEDFSPYTPVTNHIIRSILEGGSYLYGHPVFKGRDTEYRYISYEIYNFIYDKDGNKKKNINDFKIRGAGKKSPIHYEHVVPMNLFYRQETKLYNDDKFVDYINKFMQVCCVSNSENKRLSRQKMYNGNDEGAYTLNLNTTDPWYRYKNAKDGPVKVFDLYTEKWVVEESEDSKK